MFQQMKEISLLLVLVPKELKIKIYFFFRLGSKN